MTALVPIQQSSSIRTGRSGSGWPSCRRSRSWSRMGSHGTCRNGWLPEEMKTFGARIHCDPMRTWPFKVHRRWIVVRAPMETSAPVCISTCSESQLPGAIRIAPPGAASSRQRHPTEALRPRVTTPLSRTDGDTLAPRSANTAQCQARAGSVCATSLVTLGIASIPSMPSPSLQGTWRRRG